MANSITHKRYDDTDSLRMNNGLTDLFFVVLALSSSALARTPDEERFVLWIVEHDQTVRGSGAVSFDLSGGATDPESWRRFPWTFKQFQVEKAFLLAAIDDAMQGHRWPRENYPEAGQYVFDALAKFRHMVKRCREKNLDPETPYDVPSITNPSLQPIERCPIHRIVLRKACFPGDPQCLACILQL